MPRSLPAARSSATLLLCLAATTGAAGQTERADVPVRYAELTFREIGPAVTGGRLHDVEAYPFDPSTIFVAAASGGIWKSTNHGTTWRAVFDDQGTSTFGDLGISRSHPHVLYAGTGEQNNRQSTSWGDGVYRSDDAGETWRHVGLTETRHIGRVLVHPEDPDIAWVAALGNLWAASPERGVFRTRDGGRTWDKVLFVDSLTGAVDLAMDACDPGTLYAATYQRLRRTWGFNGGGPGSGIWRTRDGGESWERLTTGLPSGDMGRIGVAAAGNACGVLNAIVETAEDGTTGVYRSEDGGSTWRRMSGRNIRPMYYSHIAIDPTDADRVYTLATYSARSEDGGATWTDVSGRLIYDVGVHSDHHAIWINPLDPEHYYLAGDGGLYETFDRGETYRKINNIPVAQAYAIGADMRDPYHLYIGLQDNHSWLGPSATRHWAGILGDDWRQTGFSDGMYQQPDPTDHRILYSNNEFGGYNRVDTETGDRIEISPRAPEGEPDYRFDWVAPGLLSRHDPRVFYAGGNRLFISRDRGSSWDHTADLSRQIDRDTLTLMGVPGARITISRNDGTASFGEITTIAESPFDASILWVGTDDGNVQLSRDGGATWTNVAGNVVAAAGPGHPGVPDGTYVSRVIASHAAPGTAYVTFDAHRDGDFRPYVFRTTDFGRSWTALVSGLEGAGSVNVIAEHPDDSRVLFLGTEHALWISTDAGASWHRLGANLPTTAYDDLLVQPREKDLVVGTHGRGLWILDDAGFLANPAPDAFTAPAHLFPARRATIHQYWKDTSYRGMGWWNGANPPWGAILTYHLAAPAADARISIRRAGEVVRTLPVDGTPGVIHRVVWDLRWPPTEPGEVRTDLARPSGPRGPFVAPGAYDVSLEAGDASSTRRLVVRGDPMLPQLTDADYRAREAFLRAVQDVQRRAGAAAESADADRRRELASLRRDAGRLFGEFEGGSVQPGTMFPPTTQQRERLAAIQARLTELTGDG